MIGIILGIFLGTILGILTILLGAKAFSRTGLPLTRNKNLTGTSAKVIGVACILVGGIFTADGVYQTVHLLRLQAPQPLPTNMPQASAPLIPANMPQASAPLLFTSPDGKFSIRFPRPPVIKAGANPELGQTGVGYSAIDGANVYIVGYTQYEQKQDAEKGLATLRENILQSKYTLLSERDITDGNHPGREVVIDDGNDIVIRTRYFFTEFEQYQIVAGCPKGSETSKEVEDFMSSFQLRSP